MNPMNPHTIPAKQVIGHPTSLQEGQRVVDTRERNFHWAGRKYLTKSATKRNNCRIPAAE
jgi:hypothetical protein